MSGVHVAWPGWGTFILDFEGGPRVLVDPCASKLLDDPSATWDELWGDVLLITHGHHEHLRDVARVLERVTGPVVAPPQVADFLVDRRGVARSRLLVAVPDRPLRLGELTVLPRSFPHLPKHGVLGKLGVLRRNRALTGPKQLLRHLPQVLRAAWAIRGQPEHGPFLAYDLRGLGGRVFLTCEAFTHLLAAEQAAAWAAGPPIDVALVGVESEQEASAARLTERLAPRQARGAAVHAPFERFYGRPPVVGARWSDGRENQQWWTPGSGERFELGALLRQAEG